MIIFAAGVVTGAAIAAGAAAWLYRRNRRVLGGFLAFALHELNTPLTAINMTVLNFLSGVFGDVPKEQLKWMELMRTQISRLSGISGELRDVIHLELKKDLLAQTDRISLAEAVERALAQVRDGIAPAELNLEVDIPDSLPAVSADADRLSRSVLSLIFHARKFRRSGPISISAAALDSRVALSVSYAGHALDPEEARRSLELYYPGRHAKDAKLCAVGLGLGALRAFMRVQGGELEFNCDDKGNARVVLMFRILK